MPLSEVFVQGFLLVLDKLPELSSAPVIGISGLVSGGDSSGSVCPPVWVRWVAPLPYHLIFQAFVFISASYSSESDDDSLVILAAAIIVRNCRRPIVVSFVSPVSFLSTIRILN